MAELFSFEWNGTNFLVTGADFSNQAFPTLNLYENNYYIFENNSSLISRLNISEDMLKSYSKSDVWNDGANSLDEYIFFSPDQNTSRVLYYYNPDANESFGQINISPFDSLFLHPKINEPSSKFGQSVAINDWNQTIFGSPGEAGFVDGAVHIFNQESNGSYSYNEKIVPPIPEQLGQFGHSLTLANEFLFIGSPDVSTYSGSVDVFRRESNGSYHFQESLNNNSKMFDSFGWDISVAGQTLAVSSIQAINNGSGKISIFENSGTNWNLTTSLFADDNQSYDEFGYSIKISQSRLLVGAPQSDSVGINSGAAYIFEKNATGWFQTSKLSPASLSAGDEFGYSVALGNNLAFVGARQRDGNATNAGSVYVFHYDGTDWIEVTQIYPPTNSANQYFSADLALHEDILAVSSPMLGSGCVYLYRVKSNGTEVKLLSTLDLSQANVADKSQLSLVLADSVAIVGIPSESTYANIGGGGLSFFNDSWQQHEMPIIAPIIEHNTSLFNTELEEDSGVYIYDFNGSHPFVTDLNWSLSQFPEGNFTYDLNSTSGVFTYQPKADFFGVHNFKIVLSDGSLSDSLNLQLTVKPVQDDPIFEMTDLMSPMEGEYFKQHIIVSDVDGDQLTLSFEPQGLGLDINGSFLVGIPNTGVAKIEPYSVKLIVSDENGNSTEQQFDLRIRSPNSAPQIWVDGNRSDEPLDFNLTEDFNSSAWYAMMPDFDFNDSDLDPLALTTYIEPLHGTVHLSKDNLKHNQRILYLPDANYSGSDTFTIKLSDNLGDDRNRSDKLKFNIKISQVNDPPIFLSVPPTSIVYEGGQDFRYQIEVDDPDLDDPDYNETLTITISNLPSAPKDWLKFDEGSRLLSGTPTWEHYEESGPRLILITVRDQFGLIEEQAFELSVEPLNKPPVISLGNSISVSLNEDTEFVDWDNIGLFASDEDGTKEVNGELRWKINKTPLNGDANFTSTSGTPSNLFYRPDQNFTGSDSFELTVYDGNDTNASDSIIINLVVQPVDDTPVFNSSTSGIAVSGHEFVYDISAFDADEQDTLQFKPLGDLPTWLDGNFEDYGNGTAKLWGTPIPQDVSNFIFVLEVRDSTNRTALQQTQIQVIASNTSPVIFQGEKATFLSTEDSNWTGHSLVNASDIDGQSLVWSVSSPVTEMNGTVDCFGSGNSPFVLNYAPSKDFAGLDSFILRVSDGIAYDEILITIDVQNVPDSPVFDKSFPSDETIIDGSLFFKKIRFHDPDTLIDGNLSLQIPSWLSLDDANFSSGEINLEGTPSVSDEGNHTIVVTVTDHTNLSVSSSFNVEVRVLNYPPLINSGNLVETVLMVEDEVNSWIAPTLEADDNETDKQNLIWTVSTVPQFGNATILDSGNDFNYIPDANFSGFDSFIVRVTDDGGRGGSASKSDDIIINVTVEAVNDEPVFKSQPSSDQNGSVSWNDENLYNYNILTYDSDWEWQTLDLNLVSPLPSWLNFYDEGNGTGFLRGLAGVKDEGSYEIEFQVVDSNTSKRTQKFQLEVRVDNYPPIFKAVDHPDLIVSELLVYLDEDSNSSQQNGWSAPVNYIAIDPDPDHVDAEDLSWSLFQPSQIGSQVFVSGSGSRPEIFSYIPYPDFNGQEIIYLSVNDGYRSSVIPVKIIVRPIEDKPVFTSVINPFLTAQEGALFSLNLTSSDPDQSNRTIKVFGLPQGENSWIKLTNEDHVNGSAKLIGSVPIGQDGKKYPLAFVVSDDAGNYDLVNSILSIEGQNIAPVINGEELTIFFDTNGTPNPNDLSFLYASDRDGDSLSWSLSADHVPSYGEAIVSGVGTQPTLGYFVDDPNQTSDSFSVRVSDGVNFDEIFINARIVPSHEQFQIISLDTLSLTAGSRFHDFLFIPNISKNSSIIATLSNNPSWVNIEKINYNLFKISGSIPLSTIDSFEISILFREGSVLKTEKKYKIEVFDKLGPQLYLINGNFQQIRLGQEFVDSGANVVSLDSSISHQIVSGNGVVDSNRSGVYKVSYKSSDSSGNAVELDRVVQVNDPFKTVALDKISSINLEVLDGLVSIDDFFLSWGIEQSQQGVATVSKLEFNSDQLSVTSSLLLRASDIRLNSLDVLEDNSFLMLGVFRGNLSVGANLIPSKGNHNVFIAKVSPSFTIEWIKAISGSANIQDLRFAESFNDEFLIAGVYEESISNDTTLLMSEGGTDVFVWKISSNGENIWFKSFGGIGNEDVKGIEALELGSILIAGNVRKSSHPTYTYLLQFDSNGTVNNSASYKGETSNEVSVLESFKNKIFLGGKFDNMMKLGKNILNSNTSESKYLAMLDSNLSANWALPILVDGKTVLGEIEVDAFGNPLLSINFEGNVSLASGIELITSDGGEDILIAKFNYLNGEFLWAKQFGSINDDRIVDLEINKFGETHLALDLKTPTEFEGINLGSGSLFLGKLVPWTGTPSFDNTEPLVLLDGQYFQKEIRVLNQGFVRMQIVDSPQWVHFHDNLDGTAVIGGIPSQSNSLESEIKIMAYNANGGCSELKIPFSIKSNSGLTTGDSFDDFRLISQFGSDVSIATIEKGGGNNYFLGGNFRNTIQFDDKEFNSNFSLDGFVINLSSTGSILNSTHLICSDDVYVSSVCANPDGKVYAFGYFKGILSVGSLSVQSNGGFDLFAFESKSDGTILNLINFGGINDEFLSVAAMDDNKILMGGIFENEFTHAQISFQSKGDNDIFVLQTSLQNMSEISWVQAFGGDQEDSIKDLILSEEGDIFIAGSFTGNLTFGGNSLVSSGISDGFIGQLSPSGDLLFAHGGGGEGADEVNSILFLNENHILMGGNFRELLSWGNRSVQSAGGEDGFVGIVNKEGDCLSLQKIGGSGNDSLNDFFKEGNRVILLGEFSNDIQIGGMNFSSNGQKDIFVSSFDPNLETFSNSLQIGGAGNDNLFSGASALSNSFFISGMASGTINQKGVVSQSEVRTGNFFISGIGNLSDVPSIDPIPPLFIGESKFYVYHFTSGPWMPNANLKLTISKKPAWLNIMLHEDGSGIVWGQTPDKFSGVTEKVEFTIQSTNSRKVDQVFELSIFGNEAMYEILGNPLLSCQQFSNYHSDFFLSGFLDENILVSPFKIPEWLNVKRIGSRHFTLTGTPGSGAVGKHEIEIIARKIIDTNKIYEESFKYILTVEPTIISSAVLTGLDNWKTNWFGYFINFKNLWNYHEELGWIFIESAFDSNNLWFWNEKWGWFWTNSTIWDSTKGEGFIYNSLQDGWMYFRSKNGNLPNTIFSYEQKKWLNYD